MMGVRTSETRWVVNKRQDNKLEKLLYLVGDLFELYDDARTYKLSIKRKKIGYPQQGRTDQKSYTISKRSSAVQRFGLGLREFTYKVDTHTMTLPRKTKTYAT